MRELIKDHPQTPLERAVWWMEHVLRVGSGRHIRSAAAYMSWAEYLDLNIVSIIVLALLIFSVICVIYVGTCMLIFFIVSSFKFVILPLG